MRAWLVGVAVVLLAACGSSGGSKGSVKLPASTRPVASTTTAERTTDAIAVVSKLAAAGCTGQTDTTHDGSVQAFDIGVKPSSKAECAMDGERVAVEVYADHDQIAMLEQVAKGMGCQVAKSILKQDHFSYYYATGENFYVTVKTPARLDKVASALQVDPHTGTC